MVNVGVPTADMGMKSCVALSYSYVEFSYSRLFELLLGQYRIRRDVGSCQEWGSSRYLEGVQLAAPHTRFASDFGRLYCDIESKTRNSYQGLKVYSPSARPLSTIESQLTTGVL